MKQLITLFLVSIFTTFSYAQINIEGDPYAGNPYASITDAITAANDGDVILVSGVFTESISIGKSITLRGSDPTTDIIQASASPGNDGSGSRVISMPEGDFAITIENLGIRYGNDSENGGGIDADKVTGLVTLKNLIIEDNYSGKNGGGLSFAGSNALILETTIRNNSSALDGGGMIVAPNNGVTVNSTIDIRQSLIDSNLGRNGGGIYINGNKDFGDNNLIDVTVENTTISNNDTFSPGSGQGGGSIWSKGAVWTGDNSTGNVTLSLIHATLASNFHAAGPKSGLRFSGPAGALTNFSAYNSIIVSEDDLTQKAVNFANSNTTAVVNCILGGLENAGPFLTIIDDVDNNNAKGRTATFAGISASLSSEGGPTQVLSILENSNSDDWCTATPSGLSLPNIDQRGYSREGTADAGAFEFGATLGNTEVSKLNLSIYPNPATDFVTVEGVTSIKTIDVYSILGTLDKSFTNTNRLDVSDLPEGVYLLAIKTTDNRTTTKKLVVK